MTRRADDHGDAGPPSQRMPRWVKVMLVVVGVLALAVVAHQFIGDEQHGLGAVPKVGSVR